MYVCSAIVKMAEKLPSFYAIILKWVKCGGGFTDHPNYAIAKQQMRDFGGMMSFELKDTSDAETKRVLMSTKLFSLAESLGGVESLINHPATMTHASIPREERLKNGLSDALIRLSVGIEDAEDLINDLDKAIG
jgi:cystathionine gamma-lyase